MIAIAHMFIISLKMLVCFLHEFVFLSMMHACVIFVNTKQSTSVNMFNCIIILLMLAIPINLDVLERVGIQLLLAMV